MQLTSESEEPAAKRLKPAADSSDALAVVVKLKLPPKKAPSKKAPSKAPSKKGIPKKAAMTARKYLNARILQDVMIAIREQVRAGSPDHLKWFQVCTQLPCIPC